MSDGAPPRPDGPPVDTPNPSAEARRRLSLAAVFATNLGVGLLFGFQPPLIALVLERDGASGAQIGAVNGLSTIAVILLGPVYPRLIVWLGLRRAIVAGVALALLTLLAMPVFAGIPAWLALRFLSGCALGLQWIASEIWLNRLATDKTRGTVMAIYATVFAAGVVAGPVLLEFTGTVGAWPFWVGAFGLAVTTVPLAFVGHVPVAHQGEESTGQLLGLLRAAPAVMLAALVAGLVESADISLLPLLGLRSGLTERVALLLVTTFLAGNVVLQLPIGWLADRFGRRQTLGACAIVSVVGPLLLPSSMALPEIMWPLLFLWGGTMYGFYTQGIALLGESFPLRELAAANAVFVMVYCAGGVVGPGLGGLAMDAWPAFGLIGFVSSAALLMVLGLFIEARRRGAGDARGI